MRNAQSSLNILLTGAGAPGVAGTLYCLRHNPDDRPVRIVGTDTKEDCVGKYLCDRFYCIPPAKQTQQYLQALQTICKEEKIDILLPQNTAELKILADNRQLFETLSTKVIVSSADAIEKANNKYNLLTVAQSVGVPVGKFTLCNNLPDLTRAISDFCIENGFAVVKPPCGNGSRGVRIVSKESHYDRKQTFFTEKPDSMFCTLSELTDILGDSFPDLIITEYLPGDEYTVDVLRTEDTFIAIPRKREVMRSGITFEASLYNDKRMADYSRILADALDLTGCFGFQFKMNAAAEPVLIESNPRVQGTMVVSALAGANIIYAAIKQALGEVFAPLTVNWNTRLKRYWGAIGITDAGIVKI